MVGGTTSSGYTDTTEVFSGGQWSTVGPLPTAVRGLAGVTIDNTVYMTGLCTLYAERCSGNLFQEVRNVQVHTGRTSGVLML